MHIYKPTPIDFSRNHFCKKPRAQFGASMKFLKANSIKLQTLNILKVCISVQLRTSWLVLQDYKTLTVTLWKSSQNTIRTHEVPFHCPGSTALSLLYLSPSCCALLTVKQRQIHKYKIHATITCQICLSYCLTVMRHYLDKYVYIPETLFYYSWFYCQSLLHYTARNPQS